MAPSYFTDPFTNQIHEISMTLPSFKKQEGGSHYKDMAIQPTEYIYWNNIGFVEGQVIKYVSRWKNKNGIADLKKALHSLTQLIELEESKIK